MGLTKNKSLISHSSPSLSPNSITLFLSQKRIHSGSSSQPQHLTLSPLYLTHRYRTVTALSPRRQSLLAFASSTCAPPSVSSLPS
ncbi:hypothetical protein Ahy_A09g045091 isoform B [Arachis hypogaea]|uniref:Uncharacterized protein n=1 Tax=Arachis hypogaea TaxID=3818 RepID=A0A445BLJ1_ARAHY|nr:hypothetical protein Ahy_A09g045091 isoform B [Arachis hypogaea]